MIICHRISGNLRQFQSHSWYYVQLFLYNFTSPALLFFPVYQPSEKWESFTWHFAVGACRPRFNTWEHTNWRADAVLRRLKKNLMLNWAAPNQWDFKPRLQEDDCVAFCFVFGVCVFCLTKRLSGESLSAKCMLGFFFASAQLRELTCFPLSLQESRYLCALEIVTIAHSCFHWGRLPPLCNDSSSQTKNPRTGCNQPQIWRETLRNCLRAPRKTAAVYNMLFLMSTQLHAHVKLDVSKRK